MKIATAQITTFVVRTMMTTTTTAIIRATPRPYNAIQATRPHTTLLQTLSPLLFHVSLVVICLCLSARSANHHSLCVWVCVSVRASACVCACVSLSLSLSLYLSVSLYLYLSVSLSICLSVQPLRRRQQGSTPQSGQSATLGSQPRCSRAYIHVFVLVHVQCPPFSLHSQFIYPPLPFHSLSFPLHFLPPNPSRSSPLSSPLVQVVVHGCDRKRFALAPARVILIRGCALLANPLCLPHRRARRRQPTAAAATTTRTTAAGAAATRAGPKQRAPGWQDNDTRVAPARWVSKERPCTRIEGPHVQIATATPLADCCAGRHARCQPTR